MHAQDFQEPKGNTIWTQHQVNQEETQKCEWQKVVQIISKNKLTQD